MKKSLYNSLVISFVLAAAFILSFSGCTDKGSPSLYQGVPTGPIGATPAVSSVSPSSYALAGITPITITGTNFSTNTLEDLVYFNGIQGTVTNATATQLTVIAPQSVIGDSVQLKIATTTTESFSNIFIYTLKPAAKEFFPDAKSTFVQPFSIAPDNNGNIFISYEKNAVGAGIIKITPDSVLSDYATTGSETFWKSMRFGPGGILVCVRQDGVRALYQIPAGGGAPSTYVVLPAGITIASIDYDANNYLWATGSGGKIYRISTDKSTNAYTFASKITAARVFKDGANEYLYVAAAKDSSVTIQRIPIDGNNDLGTPETYFDFSSNYGANHNVNAIDFSADGDMFLATNIAASPIIVVYTDKSSNAFYSSVLLKSPALSFAWGSGSTYLYYVRAAGTDAHGNAILQTVVRLDLEKQGAPYYGMQ
ncbi:MAG TPA: IPT/TIG domain-containing protein [Ignavibacteriaceae bacterium]|nr:IPT/TIG domain-containing protein [Ignavibacteriaceae bacterium]